MNRETFTDGKLVERRDAVGDEWIIRDGDGKEIRREPLTAEEIALFAEEGKATPDETLVSEIRSASTLDDVKDALTRRFGG